jgi:hypothetical protein
MEPTAKEETPMPSDQWKFISPQEEFQEGRAAEESAMRIEPTLQPDARSAHLHQRAPTDDGVRYFDDEVPDDPRQEALLEAADDREDLEQMLEHQHYAFPPEESED